MSTKHSHSKTKTIRSKGKPQINIITPKDLHISSCDVYISQSKIPNAGYGVFARKDFKKGDIIERAPFLEINTPYNNELIHYVFQSNFNPNKSLIVFGFGSMYNHSLQPNIIYSINPKLPSDRIFTFQAYKDIKKDEELYINYGKDHPVNEYTKKLDKKSSSTLPPSRTKIAKTSKTKK